MRTLGQALRNAIEIERAAARFYQKLLDRAADAETRAFLKEMATQEEAHAQSLESIAEKLEAGDVPGSPDDRIEGVEAAPGWAGAEEDLELQQALSIAIEAENSAALYYDAMADHATGKLNEFFRTLSETELDHARRLREKLDQL
jgi:rubrerythrin